MTGVGVEWGLQGALNYAPSVDAIVVVDVLSFSTSVTVAVGRGATVWPHPGGPEAQELANNIKGLLAGRRTLTNGPSLSPTSLLDLPEGSRLVLPSPNGGTIAYSLAGATCQVFAGALRNASAVGRFLAEARDIETVVLVPAGERWPDDSIRVAYEDLVGAGAIVSRMLAVDPAVQLSAEAEAAMAAYERLRPLTDTPSGQELVERNFADDIVLASAVDVSTVVPVLRDGCFVAA
jgi:2-phosphosulfolactate phosphatase